MGYALFGVGEDILGDIKKSWFGMLYPWLLHGVFGENGMFSVWGTWNFNLRYDVLWLNHRNGLFFLFQICWISRVSKFNMLV